MLLTEAIAILDSACRPENAESWDNPGYLVQLPKNAELSGVALAMDVTPSSIHFAKENGANLLFTHHPAYLKSPTTYGAFDSHASYAGRLAALALSSEVGLYAAHTNLDITTRAVDAILASFALKRATNETLNGYGAFIQTELSNPELTKQLAEQIGSSISYKKGKSENSNKALFMPGSAGSFIEDALRSNVDLLIAGEVGYHEKLLAQQEGMSVITLGHAQSEAGYLPYMAELIKKHIGASVPVFIQKVLPLSTTIQDGQNEF